MSGGLDRRVVSSAMVPDAVTTKGTDRPGRARYALVGNGWRSTVYLRLGAVLPELFDVVGVVTRRPEAGEAIQRDFGVPTYRTIEELLQEQHPEFVVLSVPWPLTPELTRTLVAADIPVLAETPPAPDVAGMRALWSDVGTADLVQVAEQYPLMPLHAARLALVRDGVIGTPTSAHVSSTHLYHAVALLRLHLGLGITTATVSAVEWSAPLVDPITPTGWTHDTTPKELTSVLATVRFAGDRVGLYDFTDNQWWNPLRPDRMTVRGSHGEIHDESVVRMADPVTPVMSRIERATTGIGMNYEGTDLTHLSFEGRVVFRNRFEGGRLSDDEVGVAELLAAMGAWTRGDGPAPYPLALGLHDHRLGLAVEEAARTGSAVTLEDEPWMED
ncbi:MAG TPA: Gfo/Idh/MocA family oxidoreductase [Amnibacterium sp.]|nr:Gfo/Idh/MocA family oxidoreductase [Amnibacterium sp.]